MYVKFDVWHILEDEDTKTLCGEVVTDQPAAADFGFEATCELCFRSLAHHEDPHPAPDFAPA